MQSYYKMKLIICFGPLLPNSTIVIVIIMVSYLDKQSYKRTCNLHEYLNMQYSNRCKNKQKPSHQLATSYQV